MSSSSVVCLNPKCGADLSRLSSSATICPYCGHALPKKDPQPQPIIKKPEPPPSATLTNRFFATLIDIGIGLIWVVPIFLVLWFSLIANSSPDAGGTALIQSLFMGLAGYWIYGSWTESSAHQATLGKRKFGLKVTDLNGHRISVAQAAGRNLVKFGSLFVACIASVFTPHGQGLHDLVSGTRVEATGKPGMDLLQEVRSALKKALPNKTTN